MTDKKGQFICKRRMPLDLAEEDFVNANGSWGPKRLYGYINNFIPSISTNVRCNNDGKVLTNAADTKNITFYVGSYTAKKQGNDFNWPAIMADAFAYHSQRQQVHGSLLEQQKLMNFRLVYAMHRQQVISAPMVMSLLMGFGDTYCSHTYSNIYWSSFVGMLMKSFPMLQTR